MKIQYCSDLHLEFNENSIYLLKNKIPPVGDILVLAGDITYLGDSHYKHEFFDYVSDSFESTYWIPGNHEFYGGFDLSKFVKPVLENIRKNVHLINNKSISLNNTDLLFTTLWSKLDETNLLYVLSFVNDFKRICKDGKIIKKDEFEYNHELSVRFLQQALKNSTAAKRVVITHHVPSYKCILEKFRKSWINSAFIVDMEEMILRNEIDFWIYGHSHCNIEEKVVGKTSLVTNQLGYVKHNEHTSFNASAIIEV